MPSIRFDAPLVCKSVIMSKARIVNVARVAAMLFYFAATTVAKADFPPPSKFPDARDAQKSDPVEIADFRSDTPTCSRAVQSIVFDTSKYGSAVIDVGIDAGTAVDIDALGEFGLVNTFAGTQEAPTIHFTAGPASTAKATYVVPLRHLYTEFDVRWFDKDPHGETVVYVTAIRCGVSL